jgi:hypothetical protein
VPDRAIEPVDTSEDRDELRRMLRGLSQQERAVVVLRYYCDLSEKDAAAALRLPVSTVMTAASRVGAPKSTTQSAAACPDHAPTMPHGSSAAPLFPQDVTSINVCAYTLERLTASRLLTGTAAEKYAQRFNALPLRDSGPVACPQFLTQIALAMLPVTPDGWRRRWSARSEVAVTRPTA